MLEYLMAERKECKSEDKKAAKRVVMMVAWKVETRGSTWVGKLETLKGGQRVVH